MFDRQTNQSSANQSNGSAGMFESLESRQMLSAVPLASKIQVAQATDGSGNALNQSRVTVRFSENINLVDVAKFRLFGYSINTSTGAGTAQQKTTIGITSVVAGADGNKLVLTTDRRVRKGARLNITDGGITNAVAPTATGDLTALLPKGLNKERFTLACRAFVPTNVEFFDPALYSASSALTATPTLPSTNSVTTALTTYLDARVAAGSMTAAQETQALGVYNDATVTGIFPSANVRAALASLVGTVAEPAINDFTTTSNVTGKAFTVVDFSSEVSPGAVITETKGNPLTGRLRTLFKNSFKGESFLALAPFLAHEAIHQDVVGGTPDLPDGINEEKFAVTVETMVWAQELLTDKTAAAAHTELSTHLNAELLAMLNSGLALFPRVGVFTAPIIGANALPGSVTPSDSLGNYTSFDDFVTRIYTARNFVDTDTTGNTYARTVQNSITARTDAGAFTFSDSRITFYDNSQQIISDKAAMRLANALKLKISK